MFDTQSGMSTPSSAGIGHNSGATRSLEPESLRAELLSSAAEIVLRCDSLRNASLRAPTKIDDEDEETAKKLGDFIKQIATALKEIEAARVKEKAPFMVAATTVDGVFKALSEPLEKAKRNVETTLGAFLRAKQERERAAEQERRRIEREKAEAERREREKAEAEKRRAADEARERAAAAQRKIDEAAAEDRRKLAAAQRELEKANAEAAKLDKAADKAAAETDRAVARETAAAVKEERVDNAKSGKFATTRGDYGSSASLREFWDFEEIDRETVDLEALRQHIPADALNKAVASFIRAGGRALSGTRIFKSDAPVVR